MGTDGGLCDLQTSSHHVLLVNPDNFYFAAKEYDSSVLQEAFDRQVQSEAWTDLHW